jgi:hypothetical protein
LQKLSDEEVLEIARHVVNDYPYDVVHSGVEQLASDGGPVADLTRLRRRQAV